MSSPIARSAPVAHSRPAFDPSPSPGPGPKPTSRPAPDRDLGLREGLYTALRHIFDPRVPARQMIDLADVLTPAQLASVDPKVVKFYENPTAFELRAGVDMSWLGKGVLPLLGKVVEQGKIPDQHPGFENLPMDQELTRDREGRVHWHRKVKYDGKWHTLFDARFEREGRYVKETFRYGLLEIPLVFEVTPYRGGIKLELVPEKSSPLARGQNIVFTTTPTSTGLITHGHLDTTLLGPLGDLTIKIEPRTLSAA